MRIPGLPMTAFFLVTALPLAAVDIGGITLNPGPNDRVSVSRKDWSWRSGAKTFPAVNIAMDSGRAAYTIRHDLITSDGTLGFCVPTTCNWYQSGMISVMLNGKRLGMAGEAGERIELNEGLDQGNVVFAWRHAEADIAFMFVMPRGLDRVYVEARITPHVPIKTLSVRLLNYPAGFNHNPEHVLHTPERMITETGKIGLALPNEDALLFCDRTLDVAANPKGAGPCGVVIGQEGLQSARVRLGGYGTTTELAYAPQTRSMRFCFWEFAGMADADALTKFRKDSPAARADLLAEAFTDLEPFVIPSTEHATAAPTSSASEGSRDNLFEDVSTAVRTPHFAWAPDIPGPPIDAVVIAPAYGQRETVELMQRFDIRCHAAMTWTWNRLAGIGYGNTQYFTPGAVAKRFDQALAPRRDVIIIGGIDWEILHLEHRQRILEQVHDEGTGVVIIQPGKSPELQELLSRSSEPDTQSVIGATPWQVLSAFADQNPADIVKAGSFGKGRWVALRYRTNSTNHSLTPRSPVPCLNPWEYEYYQSLLGRTVFWAADRELPVTVGIDTTGYAPVTASPLPVAVELFCSGVANTAGKVAVELVAHHLATNTHCAAPPIGTQLDGGKATAEPELPWIASGRVILTARVLSEERTLGWSSRDVTLIPPATVDSVEVSQPSFKAGTDVTGTASLAGEIPPESHIRLTFRDGWGRVLGTQEHPPNSSIRFRFPGIDPVATSAHTIEGALVDPAGRTLSASTAEFGITGRERPAFHLAIWEENETDRISALWYDRFRELGVDAIFYRSDRGNIDGAARLMARAGLFSAPMFACYAPKIDKNEWGPVHTACAHVPDVVEAGRERTRETARNWSRFGVLHYGDGSDKHMHGNCFCEHTLTALRQHLQSAYRNLAPLNQAWKTSFAQWSDVVPDTLAKARDRGHFRSWLDHTRFMETSYIAYNRAMRDALHEVDPGAPVGPDGYGRLNSRDGSDWWQLLQTFSFYNLYTYQDPPQLEITRSLAQHFSNVKLRSIYYGSYTNQFGNPVFLRTIPWYALLHDYNGLFWWSANGKTTWAFSNGRLAGPDFRATRSYLQSREGIDAVREGLVHLIRVAKRDHNGIAIYYDQTAVHAATAYAHPSSLVRSCQSFEKAIEDVGYQYDYVAAPQIRDGYLTKGKFRVLILPHILAMSRETANIIRAFAENGGLVLADTPPARYDENLHPFGDASPLAGMFAEPGQVTAIGKDMGLLMTEDFRQYWRQRTRSAGPALRKTILDLLTAHALAPEATIPSSADTGHAHLETVVYRHDDARYIGVINRGAPLREKLKLKTAGVVYDLRARRCLGQKNAIELSLASGDIALFALYPKALPEARVEALKTQLAPGDTARLSVSVEGSVHARRAVIVSVFQPNGHKRAEYARVLETAPGRPREFVLPFALNDAPGEWRVETTDTITGKQCVVALTLSAH